MLPVPANGSYTSFPGAAYARYEQRLWEPLIGAYERLVGHQKGDLGLHGRVTEVRAFLDIEFCKQRSRSAFLNLRTLRAWMQGV